MEPQAEHHRCELCTFCLSHCGKNNPGFRRAKLRLQEFCGLCDGWNLVAGCVKTNDAGAGFGILRKQAWIGFNMFQL